MSGKVWLVGAGPGDVGLLTLKGYEVLQQAEVVVYDALVGPGVMALIPEQAEKINAGKRASNHIKRQEETNQILLEKAQAGKRVVRLKGGDPFLFGRGGEELELLAEHGVAYEVVPGVTSAISVPAYNGIPVTHRDFCSSVHIITGHKKKNEPLDLNFQALAQTGGTLVFLMGVSALPDICRGLMEGGMQPDTPAAILQKGATAEQKALVATLQTLPQEAAQAKIEMPAIIVVGGVCTLHEKFAWAEKLPLFGCRVVVTRPRNRTSTLSQKLRKLGAQVIDAPTICTDPLEDQQELFDALDHIDQYQWIVFTSPYGARVFLDAMQKRRMDMRALAGAKIGAIGCGTAQELAQRGLFADLIPGVYDAEHLGAALAKVMHPGDRVLIPRAKEGSPLLLQELDKVPQICVEDLPVYETTYRKPEVLDLGEEFTAHPGTLAVFTSASTVRGFAAAAPELDLKTVPALCIGKQTAAQAEEYGMPVEIAERATIDDLVKLVKAVHGRRKETWK